MTRQNLEKAKNGRNNAIAFAIVIFMVLVFFISISKFVVVP